MKKNIAYLLLICLVFTGCKKYLDKIPDQKLSIPTSLTDFQQLLDYPDITDQATPALGSQGTDDYYLDYATYQSQTAISRNAYIWAKDIYEGASVTDWNIPYNNIYKSNVVLEGLSTYVTKSDAEKVTWNTLYGSALFIRAFGHYGLEETFGQPYKPASASLDLGIPLKLSANLSILAVRSTVQTVYDQIISDLKQAATLLPDISSPISRPSRIAALSMLARVYLTIQNYDKALAYADSALLIRSNLFDYNTLSSAAVNSTNPFSAFAAPNDLPEVIYPAIEMPAYTILRANTTAIDTVLYNMYSANDLRKTVFFSKNTATNSFFFKGKYSGSTLRLLSGPCIDEMYLIRAEVKARLNNVPGALADLNTLLKNRYMAVGFVPVSAANADDALTKIIDERRKELLFRGLRWIDLRRLSQEAKFSKNLVRVLNGQTYTLAPNDPRYTYPIPDNEIRLSGISQNPR